LGHPARKRQSPRHVYWRWLRPASHSGLRRWKPRSSLAIAGAPRAKSRGFARRRTFGTISIAPARRATSCKAGLDSRGQLISWRHRGFFALDRNFFITVPASPRAPPHKWIRSDFPAPLSFPTFAWNSPSPNPACPLGYWRSVDSSGKPVRALKFSLMKRPTLLAANPLEFLLAAFGPARKISIRNNETFGRRPAARRACRRTRCGKIRLAQTAPLRAAVVVSPPSFGWGRLRGATLRK